MSRTSATEFKTVFERLATNFLEEKIEQAAQRSEHMRSIIEEAARYVLSDGKRLRPQLFCWGYWGAGGVEDDAIRWASISIELIHSYLLIHDDIIDRDEMRRGEPTVHVVYRKLSGGEPDDHLGTSLAIIAGDALCSYGYELIAESPFPAEYRLAAIARLNSLLDEVITGELLDILSPFLGDQLEEQDIMDISHYKTAVYTVVGPLHLGGLLAGASEELLAAYTAYALPIGTAFQLKDDILGVFGDSKATGKSTSTDLTEGKRTLLVHKALNLAPATDARYLRTRLNKAHLTTDEVSRMRGIIRESGALAEVEALLEKLHREAIESLDGMECDQEAIEFLRNLADFIVKRNK